jgi:flagellar basal-body rod protein FlgC
MSFLKSMDISASALTAQRLRMDVISQNVANANTTRTAAGGPYRRRMTVLSQQQPDFSGELAQAEGAACSGVEVSAILEDQSPFILDYDPSNPDVGADGYVRLPNVDITQEMLDMISATRSYEANVTALNATKGMALKALEIGK